MTTRKIPCLTWAIWFNTSENILRSWVENVASSASVFGTLKASWVTGSALIRSTCIKSRNWKPIEAAHEKKEDSYRTYIDMLARIWRWQRHTKAYFVWWSHLEFLLGDDTMTRLRYIKESSFSACPLFSVDCFLSIPYRSIFHVL